MSDDDDDDDEHIKICRLLFIQNVLILFRTKIDSIRRHLFIVYLGLKNQTLNVK